NVVGSVVTAGGLALALLCLQIDGPAMICRVNPFQMEFQQPFVDGAQVTLRKVAVINKLSINASKLIDSLLEVPVTNNVLFQEGMAFWVKEAAIEGRHAERWTAFVNDAKERLQLWPERGRVWQKRLARSKIPLNGFIDALRV